ncbi:MAG: hypothetical protein J6U59_05360 [Alistipes sp.]|nr:hypothetical protein [Alistipes sp.]
MRNIIWTVAALILFASCSNDRPQVNDDDFSVTTSLIEVTDIGGTFKVEYQLKSYIEGMMPVAVTEAEWITDIDNSAKGVISFRVLPNYNSTERNAIVELRYIDTDTKPQIIVRQAAADEQKLTIEITNIGYSECSVNITPRDDTMPYIVMMAEKSYFTSQGISDEESLIYADQTLFNSYLTDNTLEEFLNESGFVMRGQRSKRWQDLSPAKEYIIYAYGIYTSGDDYERITPVYHKVIDKRLPNRTTEHFTATITADGPEVEFSVKPEEWNGYYMVQLIEDSEAGYVEQGLSFSSENEEQVAEAFFYIADHLYYFEDKSAEEIMQQLGYRGEAKFSKTLNANHRYMALIYAIASDGGDVPMVVSKPQVEYFTTGTVERSDMTFEVEFTNIRPRSVDIKIIPSKEESYTAVMMYAKNLPDGDKQEQLDYVMEKYAPLELTGVYDEHIDQLPPDTEFVIAVCGYYAGAPTTDLFVYRFATTKDGEGVNKIVNVNFSAYDLADVVAIEPYYGSMMGYADYFLSMEVETLMPSPTLHFELYAKSQYDSYTHKEIRESLLEYAYTSSPDWALCSYGNEYVLCGLAEDENGYVGEMYVSEPISFSREQTSDAAIFVELYKEWVE